MSKRDIIIESIITKVKKINSLWILGQIEKFIDNITKEG